MNYPLYRIQKLAKLRYEVRVVDEDDNVLAKSRAINADEACEIVGNLERHVDRYLLDEYWKEQTIKLLEEEDSDDKS